MKVKTPEISWFGKKAIMSLDFQWNDGSSMEKGYRLATSGLSDDDKFIRIWRIVFEDSKDVSKFQINYLCGLGYHQTVVNVVKFSPCDSYLAAGDSDGLVVIWQLKELFSSIPDIFAEDEEEERPLEKWTPSKKFRDHLPSKDVLDLCWSSDGKRLVSCGIDHAVIVWDVEKGTKLVLIKEHESRHPLGVTWDPKFEYFVTLANSRSMSIYATVNCQRLYTVTKASVPSLVDAEKHIVSKIFYDDTLFTFSRRLCFSPCGELLFAPAGVIEEGASIVNATYVFTRHQLTKPAIGLISEKEIPFAVRCCPTIFELLPNVESVFDLPYRIIAAVLTKDSVIFYDMQSCAPMAYVSHMQYGRALDLSWTENGRCLVISAQEGYCTFITFDENELGTPLNEIPKPTPPPEPEPEPEIISLPLSPEKPKFISIPTTPVLQPSNTLSKWFPSK